MVGQRLEDRLGLVEAALVDEVAGGFGEEGVEGDVAEGDEKLAENNDPVGLVWL